MVRGGKYPALVPRDCRAAKRPADDYRPEVITARKLSEQERTRSLRLLAQAEAVAGLGLRSIRDRVALLGGRVEIGTFPGSGAFARIRIRWPVSFAR